MKIIEAMKRVKLNDEKVVDLQGKIASLSANLNVETPAYPDPAGRVKEWVQSCVDLSEENVKLLVAIQRTNLQTQVTIDLGGVPVTKNIAEWVWHRRKYATVNLTTWSKLTDRGLREGSGQSSTGIPLEVKIIRHYDPVLRDSKMELYRQSPHLIDAALEIVNATTELADS